jgi:hypothetical protein
VANYILYLGFDWNSPPIGSIWATEGTDYRFLQYALANDAGAPAWFRFAAGDTFTVVVCDLSESAPVPVPEIGLSMSISALDPVASGSQTYEPATMLTLPPSVRAGSTNVSGRTEYYFTFSAVELAYGPGVTCPPWGPCRGTSTNTLGPVTFSRDNSSFKLSYRLEATRTYGGDRESRVFVSDPEVIVGSRG